MKFVLFVVLIAGCGPKAKGPSGPETGGGAGGMPMHTDDSMPLGQPCAEKAMAMPETDESKFGALEVGADWQSYHKVSTQPFPSKTHGGRFVEVWVNDAGFEAYTQDKDLPEGTVIVKTSWENQGGKPTDVAGPVFYMKKEAKGYLTEHEDWNYGIQWEKPTEAQMKFLKGPIYWRGHSDKVGYCYKCHDNYDRDVGGVPPEYQAWKKP